MAKINHPNQYETINSFIESAKMRNTVHLYAEDEELRGNAVIIRGRKLWHFATTGYLGLEQDPRLKQAAAEAVFRYGTQFPLSKTYLSHPLYAALEEKMEQIYRQPVLIAKNSTLAHMAVIPQAVAEREAVILDHHVHWSVHNACSLLKNRGIPVYMIRHNSMQQLEDYLKKFGNKYRKIWYMADGIYSMYGDKAPVSELKVLMQKYPLLNIYFDDVHGMSWTGIHGCGFIKGHWEELPSNIVLISTLSKTFGASGATILCGDKQLQQQIRNFGGPLTFSAQLEPASVAAAVASATIHLHDEIYDKQRQLRERIVLMDRLLRQTQLPVLSHGNTPVFYIGTAAPDTAYSLVNRMHAEGFFVNPGIFPAVPPKNAGLRITVSNHNSHIHIEELVKALEYHMPLALAETSNNLDKVYKAFGYCVPDTGEEKIPQLFKKEVYTTLREIDRHLWNSRLGKEQALDYDGMCFVEDYFSGLPENDSNHMEFKYYKVTDNHGNLKALTHTSMALWKEDLLAPERVSEKVEKLRNEDSRFLTSYTLSTGCTFTEGMHVYLEEEDRDKNIAVLLELLEEQYAGCKATKLVLRDFEKHNDFSSCIMGKGFIEIEMPETAVFSESGWSGADDFEAILPKRAKRHLRKDVLPYTDTYHAEVKKQLDSEELDCVYRLYLNVKNNNKAINNFTYDKSLFSAMNEHELWEFMLLKSKQHNKILGVVCCFINKTNHSYNPVLIGMQEMGSERLQLYRQLLFQTLLHAKKMEYITCYLGMSAIFEKRKLGAGILKKYAYIRMDDTYNTDLLQQFG